MCARAHSTSVHQESTELLRTPQPVEKVAIWPVGRSKMNPTPPNQGKNTAEKGSLSPRSRLQGDIEEFFNTLSVKAKFAERHLCEGR
jgi:hypothetical protein